MKIKEVSEKFQLPIPTIDTDQTFDDSLNYSLKAINNTIREYKVK